MGRGTMGCNVTRVGVASRAGGCARGALATAGDVEGLQRAVGILGRLRGGPAVEGPSAAPQVLLGGGGGGIICMYLSRIGLPACNLHGLVYQHVSCMYHARICSSR